MSRLIKTITLSIAAFIIIMIVIAGLLASFVDPNDYKDQLAEYVQSTTGRTLTIDGDIGWTFFPWLGLSVTDLRVDNAPGFTPREFAKVKNLEISVKLLPLLLGKVKLGDLTVDKLHLNLITNSAGKQNWSKPTKKKDEVKIAEATKPSEDQEPLDIKVSSIKVKDSSVNWIDRRANQTLRLSKLNFTGKNLGTDKLYPLKLSFNLESNQPALAGAFNLVISNLVINDATQNVSLPKGALFPVGVLRNMNANGHFNAAPLTVNKLRIDSLSADFLAQNGLIKISPIKGKLYRGRYNGNIRLNVKPRAPLLTFDEKLSGLQIGPLLKDVSGSAWISGKTDLQAKLTTSGHTMNNLRRNLNGSAKIITKGGEYGSVDVGSAVSSAANVYKKGSQTTKQSSGFDSFSASFNIHKGVANSTDILVNARNLQVTGAGNANIVNEALKFKLLATLSGAALVDVLADLQKLLGGSIPLRLHGTFSKPRLEPDAEEIAKAMAKSLMKKQMDQFFKPRDGRTPSNQPKEKGRFPF